MICLAFVAKLWQLQTNKSCAFPGIPAQFPLCHLQEGNIKNKKKEDLYFNRLYFSGWLCVWFINMSCWSRTLAGFGFFPGSDRLCQFTFLLWFLSVLHIKCCVFPFFWELEESSNDWRMSRAISETLSFVFMIQDEKFGVGDRDGFPWNSCCVNTSQAGQSQLPSWTVSL